MRLLECRDDGGFYLKDFLDDQVPLYAILSHTWLRAEEGEEPTYEDMMHGTGREKLGYEKIRFCGERAKQDGLEYFWVDTCCINKENYAELQYAINSMFRWYRNAHRCYVYLSDVSESRFNVNNGLSVQSWDSEFWKSRWFTRGWTLQELLAPRSVQFFSRERKLLGDKNSLKRQIKEITGIPMLALQRVPLSQFSVSERFSWMERRQTTLEVDRVYSLLGILDIKIPLFKDTEAATAFERLQEVIDKRERCIQDLRLTDPCDDKKRIEETKGGLLEGAYQWIIESSEFKQWHSAQQSLLWVKGDPGKGKTMLLCGIINELSKPTADTALLSYFFCQATDSRINNAVAMLRGLIYMLVSQQPSLVSHIQKKYDHAGKALFKDINAWVALSEIFTNILRDPDLHMAYLVIDALDECVTDLPKLLDFVVQTLSVSRVKWIVSSRNWPSIEKFLDPATQKVRLCLELTEKSVSAAVTTFIQFKVDKLATRNRYSSNMQDAVQQYLALNANGTFLWVALVCQELSDISGWKVQRKLTAFPPGLDALYQRMLDQIRSSEDAELCKRIIAVVSVAHRPLTLDELVALVDMPNEVAGDLEVLLEVIRLCGSFLTLREHTVFFVHQSAKEFLIKKASKEVFLSGIEVEHYNIFLRSLQIMSRTLRRDIYSLRAPGFSIDQIRLPNPDPLAAARYSCLHWVDHLFNFDPEYTSNSLKDGGIVYEFLCQSFLYWLEAISLMKSLSSGITMITNLENKLKANRSPNLYAFIHDAMQFALYNRLGIENTPLQLYYSALVFAPERSIIRAKFKKYIPDFIHMKPKVQQGWNTTFHPLEGYWRWVSSIAFSPDGQQIVSGSGDNTVQVWDARTRVALQTLKGHSGLVRLVAFSLDGQQIVSGSWNNTVQVWDARTRVALQTLEGYSGLITLIAFPLDGQQIVSRSWDDTVRAWDARTRAALQTLEGHFGSISSIAFSPDGQQIVSGSWDNTVRVWDARTRAALQTLEGHSDSVRSVAFSPDGQQIVSGSGDNTVRVWDARTGAALQTLEGHSDSVGSVAFSPDSQQIVSGSGDNTVRVWDARTGTVLQTLEGHFSSVKLVAFSLDGQQIISRSWDNTVRVWDARIRTVLQTLESYSGSANLTAFSLDSNISISVSKEWIAKRGKKILWLPSNYQPTSQAIWNNRIVLGHLSGKISVFEFERPSI